MNKAGLEGSTGITGVEASKDQAVAAEYNEGAKFWERKEPEIQSDFLVRPHVIRMLGDVSGKRVVDAGCGEGYLSRVIAEKGGRVSGVDLSEEMISEAAQAVEPDATGQIEYKVGNILELASLVEGDADMVVSCMVFCYFDQEQISKAVEQMAEVVKPGGTAVVATTHPMLGIMPFNSKWAETSPGNEPKYFDNHRYEATLRNKDSQSFSTSVTHNNMSNLLNPFCRNGFAIEEVMEPEPSEEDLRQYVEMWGEENSKPVYLIIKARKMKAANTEENIQ